MDVVIWTEQRVERLKELWSIGWSCSQIAADLGGTSRNAVIGKIHRLSLVGCKGPSARPRPERVRQSKQPSSRRRDQPPAPAGTPRGSVMPPGAAFPLPAEIDMESIPIEQRRTLATLEANECRYGFGDPGASDFFFCGGATLDGEPYCPSHSRLAYCGAERRRSYYKAYRPADLFPRLQHNGNYRGR